MKSQLCVVCTLLFVVSSAVFGQTKGTISGYVTDRSGGMIPNAKVSETEERTGAKREVVTNETGFYQFLALGPGNYTIQAEAPNFKRYESTGVVLSIDQNIRVDISMEVGAVAESVSVTADAAVVDTRSSAVANVVDDRRIIDLPLQNRNVIGLAALLPGVAQVSAPSNSDLTDSRSGPTITVNGGRRNQNYETLNGTYFNNPSRNTGLNVPPPDAVQEFRIQTSNYSADSGRNSGSIVNVATRAGTNDLHGAVWEFHRNSALNARSFFQGPLPAQHANQFGAAAGGPIIRDKVFIFGAYEGLRDRRAANTLTAFPPSAAERAGDFSGLPVQLKNPFDGTNLAGNQIPANLIDPVAQNLLSFVPVVAPGSRLISVAPAPRNSNLGMLRNDWTLSQKQTLFVHYFLNQNDISGTDLQYGTNVPGWMSRSQTTRVAEYRPQPHLYHFAVAPEPGHPRFHALRVVRRARHHANQRQPGYCRPSRLHRRWRVTVQRIRPLCAGVRGPGQVQVQQLRRERGNQLDQGLAHPQVRLPVPAAVLLPVVPGAAQFQL